MIKRRRQSARRYLLLPLLLAFAFLAGLVWFFLASRPVDADNNRRINFAIERGQSLDSIGAELIELKLIRSLPAFKIQVFISNTSSKIQAGDFSIPPSYNLAQVVVALTHASFDRWVVILEGWRREEIAQAVVDTLSNENPEYAFDADQFIALTRDLEGQLFPDTYSIAKDATAGAVIKRLTGRFQEQTANLVNKSGLTDKQALIVASLVEREAVTDAERPIIAGIIIKRLNNDWALQIDATVQYLKTSRDCRLLTCDWWPNNLTRADLAIVSPYNTYLQTGLPPAPISNPSLDSIKAAYSPTPSDYWFYLHDSNGQVHFAATIEEHNANIAKYLSN